MAKAPKKTSAATGTSELPELLTKAVNKITYGDDQVALPGDLFVPASSDEYDELKALEAITAPSDAEKAVYAQIHGRSVAAPVPAADPPPVVDDAKDDDAKDDDAKDDDSSNDNPLG
jgi:hypothetical protein